MGNSEENIEEKRSTSSHDHEIELDGIHDGLEFPTEDERLTLRRVPDNVPWDAFSSERFSFYGCTVVFTNFIQQPLPPGSKTGAGFADGQSGALGLGQQTAFGLTTFYQFWCYVTPVLGAYIADAHLGRYNTICIAVVVTLIGHILLVISAIPSVIQQEKGAIAVFSIALIVMGLGTGLFKANISPLVAEQYKRTKLFIKTTRKGERVIVDPILTIERIYMYFYMFINLGAFGGKIGMSFSEKYVGFWLAYTLPTVVFLLCPIVLWLGRARYNRTPPTGSVLVTAFRLWRFATRGRWSLNPLRTWRQLTAPNLWDSAKPSHVQDKPNEEGLKACVVFCWFPLYWLSYNQLNNNLTSQGATMTTQGVPNDILSNLDPLALIIFIPICDQLLYPALRRAGIKFSPLKKITAGFAFVLQHYIYKTNPCGEEAATCRDASGNALVSPLNVWIQSGSYILIAFSEIFASITGLEYAFTKAPQNMRSLVMAVYLFMSAIASALGEAFVALSTDPLLVWNYGAMAVISIVSGVLFWMSVFRLDKRDILNSSNKGHVEKDEDTS
ncbi:peptide transporter PTR2A [Rhodocollybia butyracea]|uniref:Peptide transporter PTR2A n=1 Tax=Rhodocollybia butyracea TaxID=206335 RepID=A0A9P5PI82_9AGAR|nr:peptide transporter PTR2A [Rhodocollybia butyracea]